MITVKKKCCEQCLFSKRKVVSDQRKESIIRDCLESDTHFECHKGTIEGKSIVCAGFFKRHSSQGIRIAQRMGMIKLVD